MSNILIVGAGPSGLAAAEALAQNSAHKIDIFDRAPSAGGLYNLITRFGRLNPTFISNKVETLKSAGVNFRLNQNINLRRLGKYLKRYDHIFIATGTQTPKPLNIPGHHRRHVVPAMKFLNSTCDAPRKIVIVGAGRTAHDCANFSKLHGFHCEIYYHKPESALKSPKLPEIPYFFDATPTKVVKNGIVFSINGEKRTILCDFVVVCLGSISKIPQKCLKNPKIHIIGDAATGPTDLARTIANARTAASRI